MKHEQREWSDIPEVRYAEEAASREARLERLRGQIERLFPLESTPETVRSAIEDSLDVPQWGKYHNEGIYMDTHLDRILEVIDEMRAGEFPEEIPEYMRQLLMDSARQHPLEELQKYVFLHDIEKRDSLLVKEGDGTPIVLLWDHWKNYVGDLGNNPHPERLAAWLKESNTQSISYYHPSDKKSGREGKQHGKSGVAFLEEQGYEMDPAMLLAIASHEVAFQFDARSSVRYRKSFSHMTPEQRNFALLASFSDTMASYRDNGKPDLTNFLALAESYRRLPLLEKVEMAVQAVQGLDAKKVETALSTWDATGDDDVDAIIKLILETCKVPEKKRVVYDFQKLQEGLQAAVDEQIAGEILGLVREGREEEIGKHYGGRLGAAMGKVRGALKAAQVG